MLDEPVNGLDPDGILWLRALMRHLADEGRTVFVSSHLMSEVAQTADHVIVIGRGQLVADAPIDQIVAAHGVPDVLVKADRIETWQCTSPDRGGQITPPRWRVSVRGCHRHRRSDRRRPRHRPDRADTTTNHRSRTPSSSSPTT